MFQERRKNTTREVAIFRSKRSSHFAWCDVRASLQAKFAHRSKQSSWVSCGNPNAITKRCRQPLSCFRADIYGRARPFLIRWTRPATDEPRTPQTGRQRRSVSSSFLLSLDFRKAHLTGNHVCISPSPRWHQAKYGTSVSSHGCAAVPSALPAAPVAAATNAG